MVQLFGGSPTATRMMSQNRSLLAAYDPVMYASPVGFAPGLASAHDGLLAADYLALNIRDLFGDLEADDSRPDTQPLNPQDSRPVTTSVLLNTWNHARYIE